MFNDRQFIGGAGALRAVNALAKQYASGYRAYEKSLEDEEKQRKNQAAALADMQPAAGSSIQNPDGSTTNKFQDFLNYIPGLALFAPGQYKGFGNQRDMAQIARGAEQGGQWLRDKVVDPVSNLAGGERNDKFDGAGDLLRFIGDLAVGVPEGLLTAGKNFHEAGYGTRVNFDEDGNMLEETEELTGTQRAAAGAVGVLDTAGLAAGGSGKFIKEIFKKPLDNALKTTAKSAAKDTAKGTIKDTVKNVSKSEIAKTAGRMGVEGFEESLSSVAEDLQDDSQLSEDWLANAVKSFALGVAAGGIFDVSGRAIGAARSAANTRSVDKKTGMDSDLRSELSSRVNEADDLTDAQRKSYTNKLTEIGQTVNSVKDKNARTQEFNTRAAEALESVRQETIDAEREAAAAARPQETLSESQIADLVRKDTKMNEQLNSIDAQLSELQNNTDTTVQRIIANDGTDVTSAAQKFESDIAQKEAQIRDLQQQVDGINLNTGKAEMPAQATNGDGKPTLNVGMNVGDKQGLSEAQIKKVLKDEFDVDVTKESTQTSDTEPTYIPELSRPLTQDELFRLSELLDQDAIAHHTGEVGMLAGPKAEDWGGEFNAEYYLDADGNSFASKTDPSEYTGDAEGRAKAAEQVIKLRQEIEDLKAKQAEQFEMLGGIQTVIDPKAVRAKVSALRKEKATIQDWKIRNNLGESVGSLQNLKDDLERGVVPDELVQLREPIETIDAAVAMSRDSDTSDSAQIQQAAVINQMHRIAAQNKLDSLYTPEKAAEYEANLDADTKAMEAQINEYPKPKKDAEIEALYADYEAKRAGSQARVAEDADEVAAAQRALEIADDIDLRIVERANSLLESNPTAFGSVDAENMIEVESAVDIALTLKKAEADSDSVTPLESEGAVLNSIRNADDVEEAGIIIDEDPRLSEQAAIVVADQLGNGNMKGALYDTFLLTTRDALLKLENGDKLINKLDTAFMEMAKSDDTMKVRSRVDRWDIAYKNEAASEQTIGALNDGKPLTQMEGESDSRFEKRQAAVDSIRAYLDDARQRRGLKKNSEVDAEIAALENSRTDENSSDIDAQIAELNSKRAVDNYFPQVHTDMGVDVESVAEALARLKSGVNSKGNKLTPKQREMLNRKIQGVDLGTQQIIAQKNIYTVGKDGHAMKRQGAEGWSRDVPFVLEVYQRATNRAVYMQPALDDIAKMTSDLKGRQLEFVQQALKAVKGEKFGSDLLIGKGGQKALSITRRLSNLALMGGSIRTIVLQPFSFGNNWRLDTEQGGNTIQFIASTLKAIKVSADLRGMKHSPALQEFLTEGGMQGSWATNLKAGATTKVEDTLFAGIAHMDRMMRFGAYDQGKNTYLKNNAKDPKNPTDAEYASAKKAGVEAAREAQFGLGPLDVPLAQNTEFNKSIFQLQQFNMKQFGREFQLLLGDKDGSLIKVDWEADSKREVIKSAHLTRKGAINLAKTIAWYSSAYALATQLQVGDDENSKNPFGLGVEDMLPFGEQLVWMAELPGKLASGEQVADIQIPLPPIATAIAGRSLGMGQDKGVVGHLLRAVVGGEDVDRGDELAASLKSAFRQFMPMGTQLNRSAEGGIALDRGESKNKSGSTRFMIDNSNGWNIMKGLVAGQYATTEGQEWLNNGMNTIPKNMTIELDGEKIPVSEFVRNKVPDPAKKAQFIGYYQTKVAAQKELKKAGISTSDVVDNIRTRYTAGAISQAQANLELQKHNQMLVELYRPYMEGNSNMPNLVTLDFMDNVLVDENVKPKTYR